ncbi:MAG: hypothetical protein JNN20_16410 [Betaproteobacteria bacterium]|nr:hypothetical protein [Betaproteobacteria bacterium]
MEHSVTKISKALLDLSQVADEVLYPTRKAGMAAGDKELSHGQRSLLERIDGFRSLEQVLAMSGDVIGVHVALGKLLASGYVTSDPAQVNAKPVASVTAAVPTKPQKAAIPAPVATLAPKPAVQPAKAAPPKIATVAASPANPAVQAAKPATSPANAEVENAKRLLLLEAKMVLGEGVTKLAPRIHACTSVEQVFDLIVKFQQHLAQTGKADPDVFIERLSKGLATVRSRAAVTASAPRAATK